MVIRYFGINDTEDGQILREKNNDELDQWEDEFQATKETAHLENCNCTFCNLVGMNSYEDFFAYDSIHILSK